MDEKTITTFRQRRQLAIDIANMAQTENQQSLIQSAIDIGESYPDGMIQAEVLRNLDTPDSQLRGGLGHLAELLPRENIAPALRSIAADRTQPDQTRLTATMILSHFIGESVPQPLLRGLNQSDDVAYQSLLEAVEEGRKNRHVLLEYVLQMREAGDHVPPLVMDMMERLPEGDRVEMLRLIALDDRESVAVNALGRLEGLATESNNSDAVRVLHILQFMLPPNLTRYAEDALRRLRFKGCAYSTPEPVEWRALISLADLSGSYSIWFVRTRSAEDTGGDTGDEMLYISLNEYNGVVMASYEADVPAEDAPPRRNVGQLHTLDTAGGGATFVEAPFDYARWRVLETLPALWDTTDELPSEYRLYADALWQFARPNVDADLERYFLDDAFEDTIEGDDEVDAIAHLAQHTAMEPWFQHNQSLIVLPPDMKIPDSEEQRSALVNTFLTQIEQHPDSARIAEGIAESLRTMAAWFAIAGQTDAAELAQRASQAIANIPLSRNPILTAIVEAEFVQRAATDKTQLNSQTQPDK